MKLKLQTRRRFDTELKHQLWDQTGTQFAGLVLSELIYKLDYRLWDQLKIQLKDQLRWKLVDQPW